MSFAYNLTPDVKTGIGGWTEDLFIQTLRKGKFMGMSRDILPPMPWQSIGQMSDDDLKAVFAYLKSLPPISNPIPTPIPPAMQKSDSVHHRVWSPVSRRNGNPLRLTLGYIFPADAVSFCSRLRR